MAERRLRVMVVDDDPCVLHAMALLLGKQVAIETSPDAETALRLLGDARFDAVITDHDMPVHDGIWLLEAMRRLHPGVRRILTSGGGVKGLDDHLRSGLVHGFVPKPALAGDLLAALG